VKLRSPYRYCALRLAPCISQYMMTMERIVAVAGCEIEGLPRDQHPVDGQLEAATSFSLSEESELGIRASTTVAFAIGGCDARSRMRSRHVPSFFVRRNPDRSSATLRSIWAFDSVCGFPTVGTRASSGRVSLCSNLSPRHCRLRLAGVGLVAAIRNLLMVGCDPGSRLHWAGPLHRRGKLHCYRRVLG